MSNNGITFVDTVVQIPAAWANSVNALTYNVFKKATTAAEARSALNLGTLSHQDAANVNILGGNLNNVTIGETTASPRIVADVLKANSPPSVANDVVTLGWLRTWIVETLATDRVGLLAGLGSMAAQNSNNVAISGGVLNNVDIGLSSRASGRFTTVKASNPPTEGDDVVTLGWLSAGYGATISSLKDMAYQPSSLVNITGGSIDGANIGSTTPGNAAFSRATVSTPPSTGYDVTNKQYVDSAISTFGQSVKTMAYQDAWAVSVVGGTINNTVIGGTTPEAASFKSVFVTGNAAIATINTKSLTTGNIAGLRLTDNSNIVASFVYSGGLNTGGGGKVELDSNVPFYITGNGTSGLSLIGPNATLAGNTYVAQELSEVFVSGIGASPAGTFKAKLFGATWAESLRATEALVEKGVAASATVYNNLQGSATIDTSNTGGSVLNLTDNVVLSISPPNTRTGIYSHKVVVKQNVGAKNITWPANVLWGAGLPPDYNNMRSSDFDLVDLWTYDGGATWHASSGYANSGYNGYPIIDYLEVR